MRDTASERNAPMEDLMCDPLRGWPVRTGVADQQARGITYLGPVAEDVLTMEGLEHVGRVVRLHAPILADGHPVGRIFATAMDWSVVPACDPAWWAVMASPDMDVSDIGYYHDGVCAQGLGVRSEVLPHMPLWMTPAAPYPCPWTRHLHITGVMVEPEWRGHRRGLVAIADVMARYAPAGTLVSLWASPPAGTARQAGKKALSAYYGRLGFVPLIDGSTHVSVLSFSPHTQLRTSAGRCARCAP